MSDVRTPSAPSAAAARLPLGLGRVLRRPGARRARGGGGVARLRRPGRPRVRTLLLIAVAATLLTSGWFWLRDSSLVTVRDVQVTGLTGAQADDIRRALEEAAASMTTLHVREATLRTAVEPYSIVKDIEIATDFPRGMRIHVISNVAVGAVELDGRRTPVTADGTLLRDVTAAANLPHVPLRGTPVGSRLKEGEALTALAALGAAPPALRTRVERVQTTSENGLELQLANGPVIWFGTGERLLAKWAATAAVIADPEAAGASYVDVSAPERPAVGGLPDGVSATPGADLGSSSADAATGSTGGSSVMPDPAQADGATTDPSLATGTQTPDSTVEPAP